MCSLDIEYKYQLIKMYFKQLMHNDVIATSKPNCMYLRLHICMLNKNTWGVKRSEAKKNQQLVTLGHILFIDNKKGGKGQKSHSCLGEHPISCLCMYARMYLYYKNNHVATLLKYVAIIHMN